MWDTCIYIYTHGIYLCIYIYIQNFINDSLWREMIVNHGDDISREENGKPRPIKPSPSLPRIGGVLICVHPKLEDLSHFAAEI